MKRLKWTHGKRQSFCSNAVWSYVEQKLLRLISLFALEGFEAAKAASHPAHPAGPLTGCDVLCPPIGCCINCSVETLSYQLLSFSVGGWWCGEGDMLRFDLIIVSVTLGQKHWVKPTKITLAICCWMSSFPQRGTQVCPPMGRKALWVSLLQQQTLFKSNYLSGSNFLIDKWWGWTRWFQKNFRTVGLAD